VSRVVIQCPRDRTFDVGFLGIRENVRSLLFNNLDSSSCTERSWCAVCDERPLERLSVVVGMRDEVVRPATDQCVEVGGYAQSLIVHTTGESTHSWAGACRHSGTLSYMVKHLSASGGCLGSWRR
jgi:hypothetical protein